MYKPLADSTLMSMNKKELIEQLRIAEHNHEVCEEAINQQYENFQKLLADESEENLTEEQRAEFDKVMNKCEKLKEILEIDSDTASLLMLMLLFSGKIRI